MISFIHMGPVTVHGWASHEIRYVPYLILYNSRNHVRSPVRRLYYMRNTRMYDRCECGKKWFP